ncbi:hypothetical protein [Streptomyces sp. NPDC020965]|uniref:hypothetical protein n=1 Tax=Streptomyces sp. NPDC020965 TaxID=3365105 RepID=UPI0037B204A1
MARIRTDVRRNVAVVAALTAAATFASSVPALAEGSRATVISGWGYGKESQRWYDGRRDQVSTRVALEGCSTDGTSFSAPFVLYRAVDLRPDPDYGSRANTCNVSNWGTMTTAGNFYFKYTGTRVISARDVGIYW